jgi:hydroxyacylglutathione hydrolase
MDVQVFPAWSDNYIFLMISDTGAVLVVDPCDAGLVLRTLREQGGTLTQILVTHHHNDHVAGVAQLKDETGCRVVASESKRIPAVDRVVEDGESFLWEGLTIRVLATPGHTRTGVCYYVTGDREAPILFSGDTLFVGGCGRLFECDGATMWQSLERLLSLPDETRVYCGHEYTRENLAFARTISPDCPRIKDAVACVDKAGPCSVPSTLGREKRINIFLRATEPAVQAAVGLTGAGPERVFTELRARKDRF